jgi:putative ATPase
MEDLFSVPEAPDSGALPPLAERMRPKRLDDFVGQAHLVGPERVLRKAIRSGEPISMVLWGPPGVGKTTLARIAASETRADFVALSAVTAGVSDLRKVIDRAKMNRKASGRRTILFIDEIHRFNKAQQDALLHSVEDGTVTLIGATTENPSFEVISPLLSRCRVFTLEPLKDEDVLGLIDRALREDVTIQGLHVDASDEVKKTIVGFAGGDGRVALNTLELAVTLTPETGGRRRITVETVAEALQNRSLRYDKTGDSHYDTISAFIKSLRGSDPDAAVYWLARMVDSGEDPLFIARRMVILASEDVGNADPFALVLANSAFQAVHAVGMPEARIILGQAAAYLASAVKSNAAYTAIQEALDEVRNSGEQPVPLHLRNAPTGLMKGMGYGAGYLYAHDFEGGHVQQEYLPERLKDRIFYRPKEIGREKDIKSRLEFLWKKRRDPAT